MQLLEIKKLQKLQKLQKFIHKNFWKYLEIFGNIWKYLEMKKVGIKTYLILIFFNVIIIHNKNIFNH